MWVFEGKYNMISDFQREVRWWGGGASRTWLVQKTVAVHAA